MPLASLKSTIFIPNVSRNQKEKLDTKEINEIITKLNDSCHHDKASFGIHHIGGHQEHYIKANPDGLKLFAVELLEAANESENIVNHKDKNVFVMDQANSDYLHPESDIVIEYITPTLESRKWIIPDGSANTKGGFLGGLLIASIFIILIGTFLLGIYQIFSLIYYSG